MNPPTSAMRQSYLGAIVQSIVCCGGKLLKILKHSKAPMPIRNASRDLDAIQYCTEFLISLEDTQAWDPATTSLNPNHPLSPFAANLPRNRRELKIPSFQRGIEWDFDLLQRCIESKSKTLGLTVIGAHLGQPNYEFILDGLQRYSAFLSLFFHLKDILFGPTPPAKLHPHVVAAQEFTYLRQSMRHRVSLLPIIEYNYHAMSFHSRMLVAQSFRDWVAAQLQPNLERLVNHRDTDFNLHNSINFFSALCDFVEKPVFAQEMSGFANIGELIYTFNGLNTVRMELTQADICRSVLVDGLAGCGNPPATSSQILQTEQQFNETFLTPTGRIRKGFLPFVGSLDANWKEPNGGPPRRLVPSIFAASPRSASRIISEFGALKDWIEDFEVLASSNSYLTFINSLGDNPFIATMMFCFERYSSASVIPDVDLHKIAVAYLRLYLKGAVGSSLPTTIKSANGEFNSLDDFVQAINPCSVNIYTQVPRQWIEAALATISGSKRAQAIFSACLLPKIRANGSWGGNFSAMQFGAGGSNWSIDHMIPDANFSQTGISPGDSFKDSLRNFLPILNLDNSSYRRTPCATKLDIQASYYKTYVSGSAKCLGGQPHPFIDAVWLRQAQAGGIAGLDGKDFLVQPDPSNARCYGEERLSILSDILQNVM